MGLTKAQLEALNVSSFPNNNTGLITPEILRDYNSASIANTVNQDAYTTDSASFNSRIDSIVTGTGFVTTSSFNAYTSSNDSKVNSLINATASYANSASVASVNNAQQAQINSLIAFTGSNTNTSLNSYTASNDTKWSNLGAQTGSFITESETGSFATSAITASSLITASISGQTLTFTKGDASTFGVIIPTGSGGGTADLTSLNAFTASQLTINAGYNTTTASLLVETANLETFSASTLTRLTNIETTTASLNSSVSQLNANTASQQSQINSLISATASYANSASVAAVDAAQQSQINSLIAATGSYSTSSVSLTSLNAYTQSNDIKWSNLGGQSGSWITESETASFARTNVDNNFTANQTFTNITAVSASFTYVQTLYETSSVIYSSGSNQFGDELSDIQTLSGSVKVQGSLTVNGTPVLTSSVDISGLTTTASFNAYTQSNNQRVSSLEVNSASVNTSITNINSATASLFTSASLTLVTASASGNTITFTKGNASTFSVSVDTGSAANTIFEVVYTGENITKGDPLYISGSQGANPKVFKADAADAAKMPVTFVSNETIAVNNTTNAIILGLIEGIDLTGYTAGQAIYVAEGGGWSTSLPSGSNSITQLLGVITKGGSGGKGLVLNPGPAQLPGLDTGKMWVGNGNNQPTEITTASFASSASFNSYTSSNDQKVNNLISATGSYATTGSNTFTGINTFNNEVRILNNSVLRFTNNAAISGDSGSRLSADSNTGMQFRNFSNNDIIFEQYGTASLVFYNYNGGIGITGSSTSIQGVDFIPFSASLNSRINTLNTATGSYATTGSNTFNGSQTISGAIYFPNETYLQANAGTQTQLISPSRSLLINCGVNMEIISNEGMVITGSSTTIQNVNFIPFSSSLNTRIDASLVTASFSGNTLTFTKGDATTFGVVIPDISGSTIDTGSFATTGSNAFFGTNTFSGAVSFTGSAPSILSQSFSGSLITNLTDTYTDVASVQQIVTLTSASYAALASGSLTNPNTLYIVSGSTSSTTIDTGSFATTGSNTFTGVNTFNDNVFITASKELRFGTADNTSIFKSLDGITGFHTYGGNQTRNFTSGEMLILQEANAQLTIENKGGNLIKVSGSATSIQDVDFIPFSASLNTRINTLNIATGSFATTGSNTFTGDQRINKNGGEFQITDPTNPQYGTASFGISGPSGGLIFKQSGSTVMEGQAGNQSLTFYGDMTVQNGSLVGITGQATGGKILMLGHSGSLVLGNNSVTSTYASLSHISSSAPNANTNIIFKTNNNTPDTIVSGSGNLFVNPAAATAGFKRYMGGSGNIMLNASNVPQISGSMAFSPTMNNNMFAGNSNTMTMRGPVSSSAWNINSNNFLGSAAIGQTAANHAQGLVSGFNMTGNYQNGVITIIANKANLTQQQSITNSNIGGTLTLTPASSSIIWQGNTSQGAVSLTNEVSGSGLTIISSSNAVYVSQNLIAGGATINASGAGLSDDPTGLYFNRSFERNLIAGQNNIIRLNGETSGSHALAATAIIGNNLIVTGSSASPAFNTGINNFGSAFFGRYNSVTGNSDLSAETVFAVGTGTSTSNRKTGFLIDSGSNSFFEGTVNISGSLLVNGIAPSTIDTGSFATTGSNSFNGNQTITGSVSIKGNTTFTSVTGDQTNVILGTDAMANSIVSDAISVAIGNNAMKFASGSSQNVAIGNRALFITSGSLNVAIGSETMVENTTGFNNVAIGVNALNKNTTGNSNFAMGVNSLQNNTEGNALIAIGAETGQNSSGSSNTFIGHRAGKFITGSANTIIGGYESTAGNVLNNNIILADGFGNVKAQYSGSAWSLQGEIKLNVGSNKPADIVTVGSGGSLTVSNSLVTANSIILVTTQDRENQSDEYPAVVGNKTTGAFDIFTNVADTVQVAYLIINPTS